MTADDRDPLPREEWQETSSADIRRMAIEATREAVRKAKEARTVRSAQNGAQGDREAS